MDLSLFFAGTAGSVPTARRGLPALLLRAGGDRILFDCGEGTQQQLLRSVGLPELDVIFITHYHLDHWLAIIGLLKTFDLRGRERPLRVSGPPGLRRCSTRCARRGGGSPARCRWRSSTRTRRSPSTATSSRRSRSSTACARTATGPRRPPAPPASPPSPPRPSASRRAPTS